MSQPIVDTFLFNVTVIARNKFKKFLSGIEALGFKTNMTCITGITL